MLKPQNLVFLLLAITTVLYFQTVNSLYYLWMESGNPAYSHGSLAFLIALYIFAKFWFSKRESQDVSFPIKLDILGLLLLLGATFLWMLASLGNIQVIQQLALLGLVGFIFWAAFGFSVFQKLVYPLLIMLTTIPIWDFIDIHLQHITALGVSFLLGLTTIPFVKEGVQILLQSGTFEIADRCSGLRMVTAIVPVALLYCYQWKFRPWVALCYVLFSILIAIFANIIRILIVVIAGHLTDMQHYFVTTDHVTLGWIVFGVIVLLFIYASNKLLLTEKRYPKITMGADTENNKPSGNDTLETSLEISSVAATPNSRKYLTMATVCLGVLAGPVLANTFSYSGVKAPAVSVEMNVANGKWSSVDDTTSNWKPQFRGQDFEKRLQFQNSAADRVQVYLAYYYHQEQGKEAIHFENKAFDTAKWQTLSDRRLNKHVSNLGNLALREYKIYSLTGQKKIIWQWYYVGRNRTNGQSKTKLYEILGKITGNPAISVIMLATDIQPNEESAEMRLSEFAAAVIPAIEQNLDAIHR